MLLDIPKKFAPIFTGPPQRRKRKVGGGKKVFSFQAAQRFFNSRDERM